MPHTRLIDADAGLSPVPVSAVAPDGLAAFLDGLAPPARAWLEATGFRAAAGSVAPIPDAAGRITAVAFGLGKAPRPALFAGALATALPPGTYRLAAGFDDPAQAALAFLLGAYRFGRYRPADEAAGLVRLVVPDGVDAAEIRRIAAAVWRGRDLINTPANDLGPSDIGAAVRALATEHGAQVLEIAGDDLLTNNLPLIHAVGAAATAERAPRLFDLSWGDPAAPRVTLVGKGVVFDTGGLDIKPSASMLLMKKDMGGAANVLALAEMIMGAGLKLRLRVLIPAVENAIAGAAFRPGDVLRSRKGLAVEIGNTDAEGRLILADALTLACEEQPALLVNLATLTGAARVALGPDLPAVFTSDERLAAELAAAGQAVGDPTWRLPLWQPYMAMIESKIADINNAGTGGFAGSITAALFLQRFVGDGIAWLHGDIFAWTPSARPGQPEGGEVHLVRGLYAVLKQRYGS